MKFPLGTVLSVTDGHLVSPNHMDGIYEILNFMTGDNLFTHQLPRAMDECQPALIAQHPELKDIVIPDGLSTHEKIKEYLAPLIEKYGEELDVQPLRPEDHTVIDPITEMKMIRPDIPIIAVEIDKE